MNVATVSQPVYAVDRTGNSLLLPVGVFEIVEFDSVDGDLGYVRGGHDGVPVRIELRDPNITVSAVR